MNESGGGVKLPSTACDTKAIIDRIYRAANMLQVRNVLLLLMKPGNLSLYNFVSGARLSFNASICWSDDLWEQPDVAHC